MFKSHINILYICAVSILILTGISSCRTPKDIVYFQDTVTSTPVEISSRPITIKPNDRLMIIVNTRDPLVSDMFNLPFVSRTLGQATAGYNRNQANGVVTYTVNSNGDIDFPMLGEIHVAGMNRSEAAAMIKGMLMASDLVKDPTVTVDMVNSQISVLGEVKNPGRYSLDRDDTTILDALGMAGDLTINGVRDNVKVIRTVDGKQQTYLVNLLSAEETRNSPVYYLQQEDVIYVEPNPTRIRQSELNANTLLTPSFWISLGSLAVTITALAIR